MRPEPTLARLGLGLLALTSGPALAFSQAPLTLAERKGYVQLSNPGERNIQLNLQVFPVVQQQGRASAALTPLSPEEAELLIRLRPTRFRLGPGSSRTLPYTVLNPSRDFFLCGVSLQGLFTVRVCSRWRAQRLPPAASPALPL
ncbi:MAG: hypothetical protein FJ077_04660 [Cyanobacteria bacterium K_DeepCast_35m_m2_023]|nr:hypothetical protein [Cyanobacteria bacterium K_DeepCast_35m_m2_023]